MLEVNAEEKSTDQCGRIEDHNNTDYIIISGLSIVYFVRIFDPVNSLLLSPNRFLCNKRKEIKGLNVFPIKT